MTTLAASAGAAFVWVGWSVLGLFAVLGLLALVAPKRFAVLARQSGRWIDTKKFVEVLDRRYDLDGPVLRYSRLFGIIVLTAIATFAYVLYTRVGGFGI